MKITFLGHACFLIDTGSEKLLTDPYLTGAGVSPISADRVQADYILVSHGHGDHVGDAAAIAKRTGAKLVCTIDLYEHIFAKDKLPVIPGNVGGTAQCGSAMVKTVSAIHGSGVPGGLATGFLISAGGKTVYFAGDTALTADMALYKEDGVDAALLPIGGVFTMDPHDALRAAVMTGAKLVVPMHYNTFPGIRQDASAFAEACKGKGFDCAPLQPGQSVEI